MEKRARFFPLLVALLFFSLVLPAAGASKINRIRVNEYDDKVRLVIDISGEVEFVANRLGNYIQIDIPSAEFAAKCKPPSDKKTSILEHLSLGRVEDCAKIYVYLKIPAYYKIFSLSSPNRIVLDLAKGLKEFERRVVAPGLEYMRFAKTTSKGAAVGSLIVADLKYFDVAPSLAMGKPWEPNIFEQTMLFFKPIFPWFEEPVSHFYKERTSIIAKRGGAAAAVNGTYFGKVGEPLGILMIDGDLISSPIYDRTAFVVPESGKPFIDNILVNTYFLTRGEIKVDVSGINEKRTSGGDIILFTPRYGKKTGEKDAIEVAVIGDKVVNVGGENSEIPSNGFVISASKRYEELFRKAISSGDRLEPKVELIPYSAADPSALRHVVGGGPRLVKGGRAYVSKNEEKFKRDIALTRAARTAIGLKADGKLILVAVDKTSRIKNVDGITESDGMTLEELSEVLLAFGARDAMNLDGGGSSTMVLGGEIVNTPANGHEIAVSNAVLLKAKVN